MEYVSGKILNEAKHLYKNLELQLANGDGNGSVHDFTLLAGSVGFAPARLFLADLERVFGQAAIFFFDESRGADTVAGLWNPTCDDRAWKLSLGYSSIPAKGKKIDEGHTSSLNKRGILAEIGRLGGAMMESVEVVKK